MGALLGHYYLPSTKAHLYALLQRRLVGRLPRLIVQRALVELLELGQALRGADRGAQEVVGE